MVDIDVIFKGGGMIDMSKLFTNWKAKYYDLKEDSKEHQKLLENDRRRVIDENIKLETEKKVLEGTIASKDRTIEKLQDQIEEIQEELDILNGHYKLDAMEDEETRLQVKRDIRVHRLEMENMELRRKVRDLSWALEAKLKEDLARLQTNGFSSIVQNYRPW